MNDVNSAAGDSEEGMAADDSLAALEDLEDDKAKTHSADVFDGDFIQALTHAAHIDRSEADKDGHEEPQDEGIDDSVDNEPLPDEEASPPASMTQIQGNTIILVNQTYSKSYDAQRFPAGNCLIPGN